MSSQSDAGGRFRREADIQRDAEVGYAEVAASLDRLVSESNQRRYKAKRFNNLA